MRSTIIRKEKIVKSTSLEPNRTRWRIYAKCSRCENEFSKLNKVDADKYCGSCEKQLIAYTKWLVAMHNKYGDKYLYNRVEFTTATTPVTIICKKHGEFTTTPVTLVNPLRSNEVGGCLGCATEFQKTKNCITVEEWKARVYAKVKDHIIIDYKETGFLKLVDSVDIICKTHGRMTIKVAQINKGKLVCPTCGRDENAFNERWFRTDIPGKVYFMHLPLIGKWKLGVTHRDVRQRRRELGGKKHCKIMWIYNTKTLHDAYILENALFKLHKKDRYNGPKLFDYGGHTELLNIPLSELTEGFVEEILRLNEPKTGNSNH